MSDAIRRDAAYFPNSFVCRLSIRPPLGVKPAPVLNEVVMDEASVVSTALLWSGLLQAFGDCGKHLSFHQTGFVTENKKQINCIVLLDKEKTIIFLIAFRCSSRC